MSPLALSLMIIEWPTPSFGYQSSKIECAYDFAL